MANSRLFIYDPETKKAVCIAKGLSTWAYYISDYKFIDMFFDDAPEYVCNVDTTRYQLLMEHELPDNTEIYWEGEEKYATE